MRRPRLGLRISPTGSPLGSAHPPGISDENNALKTGYDPALRCRPGWLRDLGIRLDLLDKVVKPGTQVGTIDPPLAGRSGLPANTVIAAGTTDGCAAFLATGANAVGDAVTSLGSTLPLKQLYERPIFSPEHGAYSHRMSTRWLAEPAMHRTAAGRLRQHFGPDAVAALSARIDPRTSSFRPSLRRQRSVRPRWRSRHVDRPCRQRKSVKRRKAAGVGWKTTVRY
jgi:hypothetical protein